MHIKGPFKNPEGNHYGFSSLALLSYHVQLARFWKISLFAGWVGVGGRWHFYSVILHLMTWRLIQHRSKMKAEIQRIIPLVVDFLIFLHKYGNSAIRAWKPEMQTRNSCNANTKCKHTLTHRCTPIVALMHVIDFGGTLFIQLLETQFTDFCSPRNSNFVDLKCWGNLMCTDTATWKFPHLPDSEFPGRFRSGKQCTWKGLSPFSLCAMVLSSLLLSQQPCEVVSQMPVQHSNPYATLDLRLHTRSCQSPWCPIVKHYV